MGTFSASIQPCLPYGAERYVNVPEGTVLFATVFDATHDVAESIASANCFGVDP